MDSCNEEVIYHYTSVEVLMNMFNGRNGKSSLWASGANSMNDYLENHWVIEVVKRLPIQKILSGILNRPDLGINAKTIKKYESIYFEDLILDICSNRDSNVITFLSSLSYEKDKLSQWRAYADNGRGVAIGFTKSKLKPFLKANNFRLNDVVYCEKEQYNELERFMYNLIIEDVQNENDNIFESLNDTLLKDDRRLDCLLEWCATYKNPAFAEEKEVRIWCSRKLYREKIEFRHSQGSIIPFMNFSFDASCIAEIVLGPKFTEANEPAYLESFLFHNKLEHVNLISSKATYR
ncbi:DUF2971 domain-containing protein [Pseudoalteromonas phenolica]|uniref:DUF2971 domain-containing protein n=1 Tax=Pseudoalteromonas phenolica TaxID=161398 RepID=A0A0S2K6L3_9GAMM|nr:DUF2971 domain-containing protein [Pseudoalteromonas phenolica]ALO43996.1 hypothetical protein PP2015_3522 [Pseudoalteromonas phenolica]MBE0356972.1 hypothetical protein [Pseudoalteromonas phenolica O-BC30]